MDIDAGTGERAVELTVAGMSCAACPARVGRTPGGLDGVLATVTFATGGATVTHPDTVSTTVLVEAIEQDGYTASLVVDDNTPATDDTCAPADTAGPRHPPPVECLETSAVRPPVPSARNTVVGAPSGTRSGSQVTGTVDLGQMLAERVPGQP